jgi:hypothetical protein
MSARCRHDSLPVMRVGDVAGDGLYPVPAVLRQLLEAVSAPGGGDDVGAGRVALVTGASAGLGARFARVLHAAVQPPPAGELLQLVRVGSHDRTSCA